MLPFDAIVLAGGRSRRMGEVDKVGIVVAGQTLLGHACDAVRQAQTLVVVGPAALAGTPARAIVTRETPLFAGPAAALGAGFAALSGQPAELVVVLAADVPRAADAVLPLLKAAESCRDGIVARSSDGHRQPLLAVYRREALSRALSAHDVLTDLGVNRVLGDLDLHELDLPDEVVADIDTPEDLRRLKETTHE